MSTSMCEVAYDAWVRTVGVSTAPGGNLGMSPLDAWRAAWRLSRAVALEDAATACDKRFLADSAGSDIRLLKEQS